MKTLIKILLLPFSIVLGLFSLLFVTIQHTFFRSNHRYKGETGVLYFAKSDPSHYRKWFNKNHVPPQQDNNETRLSYVFEFIIYTSANYDSLTSVSELLAGVQGKFVPKEVSKHRSEIATFEIACFLLSYFQNWSKVNNYPNHKEACEIFSQKLNTLTSECFGIESKIVNQMIGKRVNFYSSRLNEEFENISFALTNFILWGFNNKTPNIDGHPPSNDIDVFQDFHELPTNLQNHLKKITSSLKQQWNGWLIDTEKAS